MRGKLKDENSLNRLNNWFQQKKIWTMYYYNF